nr:MAG TPA: hypothetical protein [Caudoviricetes sp.]
MKHNSSSLIYYSMLYLYFGGLFHQLMTNA